MSKRDDDDDDDRNQRDLDNARRGLGPKAGRTGNVFVDDPFFNLWAPGGTFDFRPNPPRSAGTTRRRGW